MEQNKESREGELGARKASTGRCPVNKTWSTCGCESLSLGKDTPGSGSSCKAPEEGAAAGSRSREEWERRRRKDMVRRTGWGTGRQDCPTDELLLGNGFWKVVSSHTSRKLRVHWQFRTYRPKKLCCYVHTRATGKHTLVHRTSEQQRTTKHYNHKCPLVPD